MRLFKLTLLGLVMVPAIALAKPPDCMQNVPQCQAASMKARDYVERYTQTGMQEPAMQVYCFATVAARATQVCTKEFRQTGQTQCAVLSERQYQRLLNSAKQAKQGIVTAGNWQQDCGLK